MKCGVKFCGGCNPRYQRGDAYRTIKNDMTAIDFHLVDEDDTYDNLLVIGGCPACCASYKQYNVEDEVFKMWDEAHIEEIKTKLSQKL
ncbi:MAG: hypothetical protein PUB09_01075 [Firmicutes bacterium]|nr:hypothetical protein [Bacillota bacterium]